MDDEISTSLSRAHGPLYLDATEGVRRTTRSLAHEETSGDVNLVQRCLGVRPLLVCRTSMPGASSRSSARSCSRGFSRRWPWSSSAGWCCIASGGSLPKASRTRSCFPRTSSRRSASTIDPSADGDERYLLQLRTVLAPKTVDQLLDNVALRRLMRSLAEQATLVDPILATEGTAGFEIVNDIVNSVSGSLASSPFRRDQWLLAVTCEDRRVVRKCCIRVLLVRRGDLERMTSWEWCREHVLVEEWYHYWRIVTLHQIALRFQEEQQRQKQVTRRRISGKTSCPLVDRQAHHPRIRTLSLGINVDEPDHQAAHQGRLGALSPADRGHGAEAPRTRLLKRRRLESEQKPGWTHAALRLDHRTARRRA